jgi:hypothetical protein
MHLSCLRWHRWRPSRAGERRDGRDGYDDGRRDQQRLVADGVHEACADRDRDHLGQVGRHEGCGKDAALEVRRRVTLGGGTDHDSLERHCDSEYRECGARGRKCRNRVDEARDSPCSQSEPESASLASPPDQRAYRQPSDDRADGLDAHEHTEERRWPADRRDDGERDRFVEAEHEHRNGGAERDLGEQGCAADVRRASEQLGSDRRHGGNTRSRLGDVDR